jgi:hypothetical protein
MRLLRAGWLALPSGFTLAMVGCFSGVLPPAGTVAVSTAPHSLTADGDSTVVGYGASKPANDWVELLGTYLGFTCLSSQCVNNGMGGTTWADQAAQIFAETPSQTGFQLFAHSTGVNEVNLMGGAATLPGGEAANAIPEFVSGLEAESIFQLTPAVEFLRASNVCASSGWTSSPSVTYGLGVTGSAAGLSCATNVEGETEVLVLYTATQVNEGAFRIDVDGGSGSGGETVNVSSAVAVDTAMGTPISFSGLGTTYGPQVVAIPVTFAGVHSVVATITSSPATSFAATLHSNTVLDTITPSTPIAVGQTVTGANIPAGTTVVSLQGLASGYVSLSSGATASGPETLQAGPNNVYLIGFTGNGQVSGTGNPVVLEGGVLRQSLPSVCVGGDYADNVTGNFDGAVQTAVATLRRFGYDDRFVDVRTAQSANFSTFFYNPVSDCVHPSDAGYAVIAGAFEAVAN